MSKSTPQQTTLDHLDQAALQKRILDYLEHRLPNYPFDREIDDDYVEELLEDYPEINVLAEIKTLRWYYNNRPFASAEKPRLVLRRWLANAWR